MSLTEFFHMGGYGFYVWTSYGLALIVLVMNVLMPIRRRKQLIADCARRLRRERREKRQLVEN
jgi:heme exporter protein D